MIRFVLVSSPFCVQRPKSIVPVLALTGLAMHSRILSGDIIPFTHKTSLSLHIRAASTRQAPDQSHQFQQVLGPERRAPCRDRHEWICRDHVSPTRRQRSQLLMFVVEVDPVFTPCALVCHQFELTAVPRVERVSDMKSLARTVALWCSCRRRPTRMSKVFTAGYATSASTPAGSRTSSMPDERLRSGETTITNADHIQRSGI